MPMSAVQGKKIERNIGVVVSNHLHNDSGKYLFDSLNFPLGVLVNLLNGYVSSPNKSHKRKKSKKS